MSILQTAKLPYKAVRGNVSSRVKNIFATNEKLFKKVIEKADDLTFENLEKVVKDTFESQYGRKINFNITKSDNNFAYASEGILFKKNNITGFELELPGNGNKLSKKDINAFMHEITHLNHHLFEPKQLARAELINNNLSEKQLHKLFKHYYNSLYKEQLFESFNPIWAKIKLNIALKNLNNQDKLNILKYFKNSLRSEYLAYSEGEKYGIELLKSGIMPNREADLDRFLFSEKIDFLNGEIAKLLAKMRKK